MKLNKNQIQREFFSLKGFNELQWYSAVISVIAVLLIGWISIMSLLGFNVSFMNIAYIHRFVFVWMFDVVVLSIPMLLLYVSNYKRVRMDILKEEVSGLKSQIESSIIMAEKIRSGQEIKDGEIDNSELHKTLKNLGKSLASTKEKELQFSWVTKGKEKISDILRVANKIEDLAIESLYGIVSYYDAVQGAFFILDGDELKTLTQYAYNRRRYEVESIKVGHGLIGACAYEKQIIYHFGNYF